MYAEKYIVLLLAAVSTSFSETAGCERSDPGFNQCIVKQLNSLRPSLKKGLPHLKIVSLDPITVPKIVLKQGSGPVSIDLISTDQVFRGILNYEVTDVSIDLQNYKMEFMFSLPWLYVEGKSKIEGKILVLPIEGNGDGWSNYTMLNGKAVIKGHPIEKEDKEYFRLDNIKVDLSVKKAVIHMNNLFNGNKQLGDAMNKFMSDNWEVVFQELKPVIDETAEELIQDIAIKVFKRYSLDELFPKGK